MSGQVLGPLTEPGPELDAGDRERYARHLSLAEIGVVGQRRLRSARVLCIGAGGLGSPALLYLAAAGVGHLTVVDDDEVDLGNLQRQIVHGTADLGRPKVDSAAGRLADLAPGVSVRAERRRVDAGSVAELVAGHDVVVDGSDNFATRYLVADACEIAGVPLVWATLDRFRAQLAVFWSRPGGGAEPVGLRDLYPEAPAPGSVPSCAQAGVLGALCGVVGSMMALQVVQLVCGIGRPLLGRLMLVDALDLGTRVVRVRRDPGREPVTELRGVQTLPGAAGVPEVDAPELARMLAGGAGPMVLLDVREAHERSVERIEPSVWVPLGEVAEDLSDPTGRIRRALDAASAPGRPARLVTYCAAGVRSALAADLAARVGVAEAWSLAGGMGAWRAAGPAAPGEPGARR